MKKLLLVLFLGLLIFGLPIQVSSANLYAQDSATEEKQKPATQKNTEEAQESTTDKAYFTLVLFSGKKSIKDIDTEFTTTGITLDYYLFSDVSIAGSYLTSKGETNTTASKSLLYTIQVPYIVLTTREIVVPDPSGDRIETITYPVIEYRTESRYSTTNPSLSIQNTELSLGLRLHYNNKNGLGGFIGAGVVQVDTNISNNQTNATGSKIGNYYELGITLTYKTRFNIGYYLRQSDASFKAGDESNPNNKEINWGGTTSGLTLSFIF